VRSDRGGERCRAGALAHPGGGLLLAVLERRRQRSSMRSMNPLDVDGLGGRAPRRRPPTAASAGRRRRPSQHDHRANQHARRSRARRWAMMVVAHAGDAAGRVRPGRRARRGRRDRGQRARRWAERRRRGELGVLGVEGLLHLLEQTLLMLRERHEVPPFAGPSGRGRRRGHTRRRGHPPRIGTDLAGRGNPYPLFSARRYRLFTDRRDHRSAPGRDRDSEP